MKIPVACKFVWPSSIGAALLLGACIASKEESAPMDPKYARARVDAGVAGQSLAGVFSLAKDWNRTYTAPTRLPSLSGITANLAAFRMQTAMIVDIEPGVKLYTNLGDTAKGYATLYSEARLLLASVKDTVRIKWDLTAKDSVNGNEIILSLKRVTTYLDGKVETAELTDGDGDKQVTPVSGKADNKANLVLTVQDRGSAEKTTLLMGAGADADFDREDDNTILEAEWIRTRDAVIIGTGTFADADNDGVLTDNSKTCLVSTRYSEIGPENRPLLKKVDFEARLRILAHKTGDEPVSLAYRETTKLGRTNVVSISNRAGGDEIVKNDTMTVHFETILTASEDTLKHAKIDFVMNPGLDLKSESDDVCYAIHVATEKRFGLEREAVFHFYADRPIPHGQEPVEGTFDGKAAYANGKSASLKGSFSPAGFAALYTGPEGNTVRVIYGRNGSPVLAR